MESPGHIYKDVLLHTEIIPHWEILHHSWSPASKRKRTMPKAVSCIQGGLGFSRGEFRGETFPVKKDGEISPSEILAQQFHPSPQLQALCFLRRARRNYECA